MIPHDYMQGQPASYDSWRPLGTFSSLSMTSISPHSHPSSQQWANTKALLPSANAGADVKNNFMTGLR
jgi:hypothetical protein